MTIAELHGKSPWTTSEDFLTADVFSAFRYLPAESGIIGFLRSIPGIAEIIPAPSRDATADFYFWPIGPTREPDVLVELLIDGELYHVVIEAKYLSGPSDYDTDPEEVERPADAIRWGNQLADQLRELREGLYTVRYRAARDQEKWLRSAVDHRLLLYLTAHALPPRADLERSVRLCPEEAHRLFWSSWYHVHDYLQNNQPHFQTFPSDRVVDDVLQLLAAKAFSSFKGVRRPVAMESLQIHGNFWQGRDTPLPAYHGISRPPVLAIPQAGRRFWTDR